jgi:hypothetical protein
MASSLVRSITQSINVTSAYEDSRWFTSVQLAKLLPLCRSFEGCLLVGCCCTYVVAWPFLCELRLGK